MDIVNGSAGWMVGKWRGIIVLAALWLTLPPDALATASAHYDMKMRFDAPTGHLAALVTITLPDAQGETDFILGDRFKLERVEAGKGAHIAITPSDEPIPHLNRIAVRFPAGPPAARQVSFRYSGPLNQGGDAEPALSSQRLELDVETMWLPARQDLALQFSVDADISGLPEDLVVIPQGQFERRGDRLHVHRDSLDGDMLVDGAVGLKLIKGPDVDFYAADQADPLVALLRKHAFGAAAFYHGLFGPPDPEPVTMVIVPRGNGAGYGRRSFVVMPTFRKMGDPTPAFDESSPARFVAHEFRHAWTKGIDGLNYDSAWVSESTAEYFGLRYVEKTLGEAELNAMLTRKREAAKGAGPLIGVNHKPSHAALYVKGPVLLYELEHLIGRPMLDRVLVRPDPPDTTPAFLQALAEVAGPEVAKDFEAELK